ncbi:FAD-dependent oxidoreductase, partial [Bacillus sp. SS-TM]
EEILAKMGNGPDASELSDKDPYDVLVVGGGPAGASAAIYAARKGIRTGIVAERFGGQVMDTMGIENFISVKKTEGPKLVASLEEHVKEYDIDVMNLQRAKRLEKKELIEVELENGAILKSKSVIVSTGARWRNVGVP